MSVPAPGGDTRGGRPAEGDARRGAEAEDGSGSGWSDRAEDDLARAWDVPIVEVHPRIGSTNDRAAELVAEGAGSWTVIVADEQTRGRGRRGSRWMSPPGTGLWMSIVLRDRVDGGDAPPGHTPSMEGLPLLAGLACAEGIESLLPGLDVGLKWPNDLVVERRKVGGILCEAVDDAVVVGIGINVSDAPEVEDAGLVPTALETEAGAAVPRSDLAGAILGRLRLHLDGERTLREALSELRRRDVLAGEVVETEQAGSGRASGIDGSGALVLTRDDGSEVRVVAGGVRLWSAERDRRRDA